VRSFRLVVAYDGSAFHGWQTQPGQRTVQGTLEAALTKVLGENGVRVEGAGRTDAGVHARGQVASFRSGTRLPARALTPLLNPELPSDVRIRSATEAAEGFSARRSALARRYAYRLLAEDDVLHGRFAWRPPRGFDLDRLERATRSLEGERDFSALRSSGSSPARPVCRVFRAGWSREERGARLDIVADHFLYHMVRNVAGTALATMDAPDPAAAMTAIVESRDRARAGATAPAHGLCLEQVFYPAEGEE
jgi:tRNA pseudouridine38-40 synthase